MGDLAERAGELDPGRAAADEHERHPRPTAVGIGFALGRLEGDQDPPPDLEGVLHRLQPGRDGRPLRVVEIGVVGAGRDHERVVGDRSAVGHQDLALVGVQADGLAEDDRRVALLAQDRAQRLGDIARRQRAGRDLVEQRLEQVEIAPVDQREADLRIDAQAPRRIQAGEPATDDDHPMRETDGVAGRAHRTILLKRDVSETAPPDALRSTSRTRRHDRDRGGSRHRNHRIVDLPREIGRAMRSHRRTGGRT